MSRTAYAACGIVVALLSAASWPADVEQPAAPESPLRPADQTFLTYPEWYLVFSPDEYADFLEDRPPSEFPYGGHLDQLWGSYAAVSNATSGGLGANFGYHAMIMVIAGSTTAEYGIKASYEQTIGRTTEALAAGTRTPEDVLAADVAREYVDFIEVRPWYAFDFASRLERVWATPVQWQGVATLRSLERRYALTTEFGLKALYGGFIALGTAAAYEAAAPTTQVSVDPTCARGKSIAGLDIVDPSTGLGRMPRYRAFTAAAQALAEAGCAFQSIAGNDGDILLSVIASADWESLPPDARLLFVQPILTSESHARFAVVTPVPELAAVLRALERDADAHVEHVFDY